MEITISHAGNTSKPAIIDLLVAEKLPVQDLPVTLDNFVIATGNNAIIGTAGLEVYGSYGLLRSVVVNSNYRNNNIAAMLIKAIEENAANKGLAEIYLLTETAQQYFEKKGYAVTGREEVPEAVKQSSEFSHVCPVSAVVMKKKIIVP